MGAYEELMDRYREISLIDSIVKLLDWDLETYMPPKGAVLRSDQMGVLKRVKHRMLTSDGLDRLLKEAETPKNSYDEVQQRNLFLLRRERDIAVSVPENLVAALEAQKVTTFGAWSKAKAAQDWKMFEPDLEKIVELSSQVAEATMQARGVSCVFDAVIDDWEPRITHEKAARLLTELTGALGPLIQKYSGLSGDVDPSLTKRHVPLDVQRILVTDAVGLLGYDTTTDHASGRIDSSEHPFTSGYSDDVRITVHYYEDRPLEALYDALHEAGHALYNQGINRDWIYQPVGNWASVGVHEAMSRFAENMIGRSRGFWSYYLPRLNEITHGAFSGVKLGDLLKAVNRVLPSKKRIVADEITYQLHVAIRFEIERKLFEGEVEISELPQIWNELYDKYLQIEFDNDSEGVMQDVHWSLGSFGYFQSYALGNIYGGIFLQTMQKETSHWSEELENGNPRIAIKWLRDRVQHFGSLYDPEVLVERVVGLSPTVEPFVQYLKEKYEAIWE